MPLLSSSPSVRAAAGSRRTSLVLLALVAVILVASAPCVRAVSLRGAPTPIEKDDRADAEADVSSILDGDSTTAGAGADAGAPAGPEAGSADAMEDAALAGATATTSVVERMNKDEVTDREWNSISPDGKTKTTIVLQNHNRMRVWGKERKDRYQVALERIQSEEQTKDQLRQQADQRRQSLKEKTAAVRAKLAATKRALERLRGSEMGDGCRIVKSTNRWFCKKQLKPWNRWRQPGSRSMFLSGTAYRDGNMCVLGGRLVGLPHTSRTTSVTRLKVIARLPRWCRPAHDGGSLRFNVRATGGVGMVRVWPNGFVTYSASPREGQRQWVSLAGVAFVPNPDLAVRLGDHVAKPRDGWSPDDRNRTWGGWAGARLFVEDGVCLFQGMLHHTRVNLTKPWNHLVALGAECEPAGRLVFAASDNSRESTPRIDVDDLSRSIRYIQRDRSNATRRVGRGQISLSGIVYTRLGGGTLPLVGNWRVFGSSNSFGANSTRGANATAPAPGELPLRFSPYREPRVHRQGRMCYLSGLAQNAMPPFTGANAVVAQLPEDCRPSRRLVFSASQHHFTARIDLYPSGKVVVTEADPKSTWISFSGIHFVV